MIGDQLIFRRYSRPIFLPSNAAATMLQPKRPPCSGKPFRNSAAGNRLPPGFCNSCRRSTPLPQSTSTPCCASATSTWPGTGEVNYRNVFRAIYDLGDRFQGTAALEYSPLVPLEQNLADMRKLANFT